MKNLINELLPVFIFIDDKKQIYKTFGNIKFLLTNEELLALRKNLRQCVEERNSNPKTDEQIKLINKNAVEEYWKEGDNSKYRKNE